MKKSLIYTILTITFCSISYFLKAQGQNELYLIPAADEYFICTAGDTISLQIATNALEILWSTGDTTLSTVVNAPGSYIVEVTDGLDTLSSSISVTVSNESPMVQIQGDSIFCQGDSVLLTATFVGGNLYWSNGAMGSSIFVSEADLYTAMVTNTCGDTASANLLVNQLPQADVNIFTSGELECPNDNVILTANQVIGFDFIWSTGSSENIISISEPGTYWLEAFNDCGADRDTVEILSDSKPYPEAIITGANEVLCEGEPITLSVETNSPGFWFWSTGIAVVESIEVDTAGEYWLTFINDCGRTTETVYVSEPPELDVTIEAPVDMCEGEPVTLTAISPNALSFEWSDGTTEDKTGTYYSDFFTVTVTGLCEETATAEHFVEAVTPPQILLNSNAELFCETDEVRLSADVYNSDAHIWSTGDTTSEIFVVDAGVYTLRAINRCFESVEQIMVNEREVPIFVPNAFSPNNDGANDLFQPFLKCAEVQSYQFQVFSRWGDQVYQSAELTKGWDGKMQGRNAPTGVYVWIMRFDIRGRPYAFQGDVTLVR